MNIQEELGKTIIRLRQRMGISQEDFAGMAGISRSYMSCIENGKRAISLPLLYKISLALGLSLSELFKEVEECPSEEVCDDEVRDIDKAIEYIKGAIDQEDIKYIKHCIYKNHSCLRACDSIGISERIQDLMDEYGHDNGLPKDWWYSWSEEDILFML